MDSLSLLKTDSAVATALGAAAFRRGFDFPACFQLAAERVGNTDVEKFWPVVCEMLQGWNIEYTRQAATHAGEKQEEATPLRIVAKIIEHKLQRYE